MDRCFWCDKRLWFWKKWEWTTSAYVQLDDDAWTRGRWVCSGDCWDFATDDDIVEFNRIVGERAWQKEKQAERKASWWR